MNRYVIVSFLGKVPAGTSFTRTQWPLHITLIRPFDSYASEAELVAELTGALRYTKIFSLTGVSEELFGPELNIPVLELERTTDIVALNILLKRRFTNLANPSTPDIFTEYRPHVTHQAEGKISVGDTITVSSVSLVKYTPGLLYVSNTVDLG